jgi:holo-[acyl-carrier protein] synthase
MIKGTGIDITEIERIKMNLECEGFLERIYSDRELEYLKSRKFNHQTAAGMFAAKEAVAKCLGTGFFSFGPRQIEILKDDMGKPCVFLSGKALRRAEDLNIERIHITISHTKEYALAQCIAE